MLGALSLEGCCLESLINYLEFFSSFLGATNWISTWRRNEWRTASGKEVKNQTDIMRLAELCEQVRVNWVGFQQLFNGSDSSLDKDTRFISYTALLLQPTYHNYVSRIDLVLAYHKEFKSLLGGTLYSSYCENPFAQILALKLFAFGHLLTKL